MWYLFVEEEKHEWCTGGYSMVSIRRGRAARMAYLCSLCDIHSLRKESTNGVHVSNVLYPFVEEGKHEWYACI